MKFSIKDFFSKCDTNPQENADLVTFTEEIFTGKLHFSSSNCLKGIFEEFCWCILKLYRKNTSFKVILQFSLISSLLSSGNSCLCMFFYFLYFVSQSIYVSSVQRDLVVLLIDPNSKPKNISCSILLQLRQY